MSVACDIYQDHKIACLTDEFVILIHINAQLSGEQKWEIRKNTFLSFSLILSNTRKKAREREKEEGGNETLKCELQTQAAPSGPRKHAS